MDNQSKDKKEGIDCSSFRRKLSTFTALLTFVSMSSFSMINAYAVTTSGVGDVLGHTGNTSVTSPGNGVDLEVDVNSGVKGDVGQVDWRRFDVAPGGHVNFGFSGLSQTVINRVLGGKTSEIQGKITSSCINSSCTGYEATSKVILINPAGVVFGAGSSVDLNSFTISTFDFKGSKNLKDMDDNAKASYKTQVLDKISPVKDLNKTEHGYGDIQFSASETQRFQEAGTFDANGASRAEGATLTKEAYDKGQKVELNGTNFNIDKSLAIVTDNIEYKDSIIRTAENFNHITQNSQGSYSNTTFVTADGVTFRYLNNGYMDDYAVDAAQRNIQRQINIDNTNELKKDADNPHIQTGDFHVVNKSNTDGSDINIKNTIVRGTKLVDVENGDIFIVGSHNVNVENSRLDSVNTKVSYDADNDDVYEIQKDTYSQNGGEVYLEAGKDLNIKDSLILSAGANKSLTQKPENAGRVTLKSGNNTTITDTKVLAEGNIDVTAGKDVKIQGTAKEKAILQAANTISKENKDINVKAGGDIYVNKADVRATGNVTLAAVDAQGNYTGDIIVNGSKDSGKITANETKEGDSLIVAQGGKLTMHGKSTLVNNGSLGYKDLSFFDKNNDNDAHRNDVTIQNDSTFTDIDNVGNIDIETNGTITLSNASMKTAQLGLSFDRVNGPDSALKDDGTVGAIKYTKTVNSREATNIKAHSTRSDVKSVDSTFSATNDVELSTQAQGANVEVKSSDINAGHNLTLKSEGGKVIIGGDKPSTPSSKLKAGNDLDIIAKDTVKFGEKLGTDGVTIDKNADITAGHNLNVTSKGGNIEGEKTTMPTLKYGNRLKFDANKKNVFTSKDSLKSVNVDYVAGEANEFTTEGDIQFVDSSFQSKSNNVETKNGDVILNNHTIKSATGNGQSDIDDAKTKTTIKAGGRVTTKDVTGSLSKDRQQQPHTFPQSVEVDGQKNYDSAPDTTLDVGNTKLVVNTSVQAKEGRNDQNGSIDLKVKNAHNKQAGLELTAENKTWDGQIGKGEGPEIHLDAEDNKLSVSKLVTDKLTLHSEDEMYAASVDNLTPEQLKGFPQDQQSNPRGYIEVRDKGGFNMDESTNYGDEAGTNRDSFSNDNLTYKDHYDTETGKTTTDDLPDGMKSKTEHKDNAHDLEFKNQDDSSDDFMLRYEKDYYTYDKNDPVPELDRNVGDNDSLIAQQKLPREIREVSKTSKVSDNTGDQTSNVMSAAAKIDVSQNDNDSDDEDEDSEE